MAGLARYTTGIGSRKTEAERVSRPAARDSGGKTPGRRLHRASSRLLEGDSELLETLKPPGRSASTFVARWRGCQSGCKACTLAAVPGALRPAGWPACRDQQFAAAWKCHYFVSEP